MAEPSRKRLSLPRVWAFSTLALPLAGVGLPLGVYLAPLYADEVGLGLGLTGFLFMILRLWDVFTDPVMGFLVDKYKSPLGRIRHWLILSIPVLGLGCFFVYMPPREGVDAWYFIGWMALFYIGFTLLQTSRSAWVPAIATDYDDRSRFFLWTEIFSVLFMLLLIAVPLLLALGGIEADRFQQVRVMGWLLIISLPISVLLSCLAVPDPPLRGHSGLGSSYSPSAIWKALTNAFLGRVLLMELLIGTAIAVTASNYLFVAESVFRISDGQASGVLFLFFVASVATMPGWLWLSARWQKHLTLRLIAFFAAFTYALYLIVGLTIGGFWPLLIVALLNGAAFGAPVVLARSMTADVIEYELLRTGENRAGLYYALLTGSYKIGASFALGIGYLIVEQVAGYRPGEVNSEAEIRGLLYVFCIIPAALFFTAAWVASTYTLTREKQAETSAQLDPRGPEVFD